MCSHLPRWGVTSASRKEIKGSHPIPAPLQSCDHSQLFGRCSIGIDDKEDRKFIRLSGPNRFRSILVMRKVPSTPARESSQPLHSRILYTSHGGENLKRRHHSRDRGELQAICRWHIRLNYNLYYICVCVCVWVRKRLKRFKFFCYKKFESLWNTQLEKGLIELEKEKSI